MKYSSLYRAIRSALATVISLAILLSLSPPARALSETPSLSAKSALLMDASDRSVLFEKNARQRMGMASTTKIMTALLVAERLPPDRTVTVTAEAVNVEGSSVYLTEGERLTVEQLLCALLLASANDAATALAIAVSGSVDSFAEAMNQRAAELGLKDTHFVNPHGLSHEDHYTTAYDLAILSSVALKNPTVSRIAALTAAKIPQGITADTPEAATSRHLYNHNKMLRLYDGAIGLKTGYTTATGRCLVSAAHRDGLTLIAVTLDAPDDWRDHTAMLDHGFSLYRRVTLYEAGEFSCQYPVTGGVEGYVVLVNAKAITMTLPREELREEYIVTSHQRFEFAPIRAGDSLATLTVSLRDRSASSPLIATYGVERTKK